MLQPWRNGCRNVERALKDLNATSAQLKKDVSKEKKARNKADTSLWEDSAACVTYLINNAPRCASINLFKEVSGIEWDYLAPETTGTHCKGDAAIKTPFTISGCSSQQESIDKLWEMIGTSWLVHSVSTTICLLRVISWVDVFRDVCILRQIKLSLEMLS